MVGFVGSPPGPATGRLKSRISTVAATVLVGATIVEVARTAPGMSFERGLPAGVLLLAAACVTSIVVGAWLLTVPQPRVAIGLGVVGVGLLVPVWAGFTWSPPSARALSLAAAPLAIAGVAHVVLAWSHAGRMSGALAAVYLLAIAGVAVHALGYDPFEDVDCARTCADMSPVGRGIITTRTAQVIAGVLSLTAAALTAVAVVRSRRAHVPVVIVTGGLVAAALLAISAGLELPGSSTGGPSDSARVALPAAGGMAMAAACLLVGMRRRSVRAAVDRLLPDLSTDAPTAGAARGHHSVEFAVPGGGWVDAAGRPALEPAHDRAVVVSDTAGPIIRIRAERSDDVQDVLANHTRATWLALRNAQLAAVTKARVAEVQASRRRVCAMSDMERLRIERDLHDGAQQRLVSAAFHLSLVRARMPQHDAVLAEAERALRSSLAGLRRVSRGIFPSALANEGLAAALEELAFDTAVPFTLRVRGEGALGAEASRAAYATALAAIDHAARPPVAASAHVDVERANPLTVVITTAWPAGEPPSADYTGVVDRVGALGGRLTVSQTGRTTTVAAEIPCES